MRSALRLVLAAGAVATVLLAAAAPAAQAITGGQPDGNEHPNVAVIVYYDGTGRYRCSATLVDDDTLLTAAHCTDGTVGKVAVSFDPTIAETAPFPFPVASDPSHGYAGDEPAPSGLSILWGIPRTFDQYSGFTDPSNWNDVGVIKLDQPVNDITPAVLPAPDYLAQFAQPVLSRTTFTLVGYGTEVRKPDTGPQRPQPMAYPLIRRSTTAPGQRLTTQLLQVNGNPKDTRGGGGACFGDSGGPAFLDGYLVGVTSYGLSASGNCRYLDGYQRTDIPAVLDWITDQFDDPTMEIQEP